MDYKITLTQPDGTPLTGKEVPAKGTLLVIQIDRAEQLIEVGLPYQAVLVARVLGWVPRAGKSERRMMRAAVVAMNGSSEEG